MGKKTLGGALRVALVAVLCGTVACAETAEPTDPATEGWTLVKRKDGLSVYHRYPTPDAEVPIIRLIGTLDIPYVDAGEFLWDPQHRIASRLSDYIETAGTHIAERDGVRTDLFVFRVPLTARLAVRVGSGLRGTVGSTQYSLMEVQRLPAKDEFRIVWKQVPVPAELRASLEGYEVARNEGSWLLRPLDDGRRTAFMYELDAFPGGHRVPPGLVRWANATSMRVPHLLEVAYRDEQRPK